MKDLHYAVYRILILILSAISFSISITALWGWINSPELWHLPVIGLLKDKI